MTSHRMRTIGWALIFITLCFAVAISDRILGFYMSGDAGDSTRLAVRYVRLREHEPGLVLHHNPSEGSVKGNHVLRVDQDGFIMPSRVHAAPDWTIVFLGGSTTECFLMDELKRFPYLVGRLLEKETGTKVNSFNGGRYGNTSFNSIVGLLGKVIPMHPQAVVMMENVNDLSILLFEKSYWNSNPSRSPLVTIPPEEDHIWPYYFLKGFKNLFLKNFYDVTQRIIHSNGKQADEFAEVRRPIQIDEQQITEVSEAFRRNLELFVYICRLYNIVPVLMTQENRLTETPDSAIQQSFKPYNPETQFEYTSYRRIYNRLNDLVRQVGKDNGVLVIDLASRIPPSPEYMYDIVHFTEKGSVEAASVITAELASSVFR